MNIKISVIIPIYKVEAFLDKSIQSVLSQTHLNLELILVDDGSPDGCGEICDSYARQDKRVTVIHQTNRGLSGARNAGLKAATGDYIVFLDADDYWDDNTALERLVECLPADVVSFGMKHFWPENGRVVQNWSDTQNYQDIRGRAKYEQVRYMLENGCYIASACNKLIKRSLFSEQKLTFREGVTSEDIDWCARLLIAAGTFSVSPCCFYRYRQRDGSISKSIRIKNIYDLEENIKSCVSYSKELEDNKELLELYWNYVSYQYGTLLLNAALVCKEEQKYAVSVLSNMREYAWLLKYHMNRKVNVLWRIYQVGGYGVLCQACRIYALLRHRP